MRKNRRDNKAKYLLILLLLIAVGYAAIATTLKINGTSTIKSAKWDVYWENPQVLSGSVTNTAPTLSESDTKATFNVTLNEPGDYYEFTIDAVNNGSLDAKIDTNGIVQQVKNSSGEVVNPTILKYEVTNNDQEHTAIQEGHILAKKSGDNPTKETYRVRVEYRNDSGINPSDLDDNDLVFTIEFSVKYVQGPKANNNSENNTPTNPYLTTFDGTYTYSHKGLRKSNFGEFDSAWLSYLRNDGTITEVCSTFSNGTVCMQDIGWDDNIICTYNENVILDNSGSVPQYQASCNLNGYLAGKKEEFESKGAICHFEYNELDSYLLICHDDSQECFSNAGDSDDHDYVWCGELGEEHGCWKDGSNYGKCVY